jgi:hypothetical protein
LDVTAIGLDARFGEGLFFWGKEMEGFVRVFGKVDDPEVGYYSDYWGLLVGRVMESWNGGRQTSGYKALD